MTPLAEIAHLAHELERRGKPATSVDARAALALRAWHEAIQPLSALADELIRVAFRAEDLDGCDLYQMLAKHGLLVQTAADPEDCEQGWAQEWDIRPGDLIYKRTPLGRALLAAIEGEGE